MTKNERIACIRIFTDLIKSDEIIDENELLYYNKLKTDYNINIQEQIDAMGINLSEAVSVIKYAGVKSRAKLMSDCDILSLSDRSCSRSESILKVALKYCMDDTLSECASVVSIPSNNMMIDDNKLLYIESYYDKRVNHQIQSNLRYIQKEFKLGGFEFVYIPDIASYYKNTSQVLLHEIFSFLLPSLTIKRIEEVIGKISCLQTEEFVRDILCNQLGVVQLRDTLPAFFLKIGDNYVNHTKYSNFLKIEIDNTEVLSVVQDLMDAINVMLPNEVYISGVQENSPCKFLYHGFYKQLLDLFTLRQNVRSRIIINPYLEFIKLEEIDKTLNSLHRKEKALYTLFLLESQNGGISFNPPKSARHIDSYNTRMGILQDKYKMIYGLFGGDKNKAPAIDVAEIRRPMLSRIKKSISELEGHLYAHSDYMIEKDSNGNYRIRLQRELIFCENNITGKVESLSESPLFKALPYI